MFGWDPSMPVVCRTVANCQCSGQYFYSQFQNRSRKFPNTGTERQGSSVGHTQCCPCPVFRLRIVVLKTEAMPLSPSLEMAKHQKMLRVQKSFCFPALSGSELKLPSKWWGHWRTASSVPPLVNHQLFWTA